MSILEHKIVSNNIVGVVFNNIFFEYLFRMIKKITIVFKVEWIRSAINGIWNYIKPFIANKE